MSNKVYITGFGAITGLGNAFEAFEGLKKGKTAVGSVTHWDSSEWECDLGAEIKGYNAKKLFPDRKLLKLLSRQDVLGLNAFVQAVEHSQLIEGRDASSDPVAFNEKTGIFVASPGNKFSQQYDFLPLVKESGMDLKAFAQSLEEVVHPMWLLKILPNNVLAYSGIKYGFKGPSQNITNHAVSGIQAILEGYYAVLTGQVDRAVIVSYDYALSPQELMYYQACNVLSSKALKPFDQKRDGTIMGEGGGALVLESEKSVEQRKARVYGEVLGGAFSSEGKNLLAQDQNGKGLEKTIQMALKKASIESHQVGLVAAHGNGTALSDKTEALAINACFGGQTPVTAFKWAVGHTLSAAGVIEAILILQSLREKTSPGISSLSEKDHALADISVNSKEQSISSDVGLLIGRALYSLNSGLLLKGIL